LINVDASVHRHWEGIGVATTMSDGSVIRMQDPWLTADEAARALGIKRETLYSYVSRGLLPRYHGRNRGSRFAREDVDRLARGASRENSATSRRLGIRSAISTVVDGRPYYRGQDATVLATRLGFEEVANVLWTGAVGWEGTSWRPDARAAGVCAAAEEALDLVPTPLERLRFVVPLAATRDRTSADFSHHAVASLGARIIATLVEALPIVGELPATDRTIAARLWPRLSPLEPTPKRLRFLDILLALLADHELAPTTMAARIAATAGADPYAVVSVGLGVGAGSVHGGSLLIIEDALRCNGTARGGVGALRSHDRHYRGVPGFGHHLYPNGDPRGAMLLAHLDDVASDSDRSAHVKRFVHEFLSRGLPSPNADFGLAATAYVAEMVEGASEAMFAIARCAGWIAHAIEAYGDTTSTRRYRATYTGVIPRTR
jgi:citrate synthase